MGAKWRRLRLPEESLVSKTDKTRPIWVQVKDPDNRGWIGEDHDHRSGPCDLGDPQDETSYPWYYQSRLPMRYHPSPRRCTFHYSSLAYHSGIYGRRPKKQGWGRCARDGRARMHLRMIRDEVLKTDPREVDTVDHLWMYPNEKLLWHKWRD